MISEVQFRAMWQDFEWENKVAVNTNFDDVNQFLSHIVKSTNMQRLTPASALAGECAFLSANLYHSLPLFLSLFTSSFPYL